MKKQITLPAALILCLILITLAGAEMPRTMSYQGVLRTSPSELAPDGGYSLTFRIYDVAEGGEALWQEGQYITVSHGRFSVLLGSVVPLDLLFDEPYHLGIQVSSDPEMTPRIALASSPYSLSVSPEAAVTGLNSLRGDVQITAGDNITITPSGNTLSIAADGGGGGTMTQVNTGTGLTGGPITTTGTIGIASGGIGNDEMGQDAVEGDNILDGTIMDADINAAAGILASKILGGAGVEFNRIGSVINIAAQPAVTDCGSIVVDCPTSGYVILLAKASAYFQGYGTTVTLGLGHSSGDMSLDSTNVGHRDGNGLQQMHFCSQVLGYEAIHGEGQRTYHLNAYRPTGDELYEVNLSNVILMGIFVPTKY